ncbi:MAG: TRAP transporter substrate-binding protein [Spirochaetales bacterium]|jgi:tripartite ATP-independent transporter DctP family solute receptor|nr:TRAP transporter substrate-binding protein [Spirochaetales bacterium]
MKKILVVMLALSIACAFVFAQAAPETQTVVIKWGSVHTPESLTTQLMNKVIAEVNEKTQGRVKIEGYPSSALGGSRDLVEGVQNGLIDMCTEGPAQFASVGIPVADIAEAPYIWKSREHMSRAMNGEFGSWLNKTFLENNVRILGTFYYGVRQLTTTDKPVNNVNDVKGMKIRVPQSAMYMAMIEAWGAKATPMNLGELYLALSTHVADAQENPLATFNAQKFYEIQKYVVLTQHIICPNCIFINEKVWQKISPADQKIIQEVIANTITWHDTENVKLEEQLKKDLVAKGVTIITPDVESFSKVTGPYVAAKFESKWGKGTWEMVQGL